MTYFFFIVCQAILVININDFFSIQMGISKSTWISFRALQRSLSNQHWRNTSPTKKPPQVTTICPLLRNSWKNSWSLKTLSCTGGQSHERSHLMICTNTTQGWCHRISWTWSTSSFPSLAMVMGWGLWAELLLPIFSILVDTDQSMPSTALKTMCVMTPHQRSRTTVFRLG